MTKRRGLGKGLDALIPSTTPARPEALEPAGQLGLLEVLTGDIVPNPHQPRSFINENDLAELAASIAEHGLIQPIIVTQIDQGYQLIAGERRWRAACQAGLETVPVLVKEATSQEMLELALVENIQRADLNPLEEAQAFRHLMDEFGLTQAQVAERIGKSRVAVANTVRLLALPPAAQIALQDTLITAGHGRALLGLPTAEQQEAALKTVLKRHLNVRQTEELVRRWLGEKPVSQARPKTPEIKWIEDRLEQQLGFNVDVRHTKKGGRVVIHYDSDEDLQSLIDKIAGE